MAPGIDKLSEFAMDAIHQAGEKAMAYYGKGKPQVRFDERVVTEAENQLNSVFQNRLKQEFPALTVVTNGGITTADEAAGHLTLVDGVMIGRAAYDRPYLFAEADRRFYGAADPPPSRRRVVEAMVPYLEHWHDRGVAAGRLTRHLLQLFAGRPGARAWRRYLSENAPGAGQPGWPPACK